MSRAMVIPANEQALIIRNMRLKHGMSQQALSEAIGCKSYQTIGQIERGSRNVTLRTLKKVAAVFGVSVEELLPSETRVRATKTDITPNEYQSLAMRTSNRVLSPTDHLLNGVLGIAGEGGEVADLVKKHLYQGHPLDYQHIAKELGDICWYIAEAVTAIGYDLEHIMQMNVDKLKARYPEGFEVERSLHRKAGDI